MTTLTKHQDPTSQYVATCELCRGCGLIEVRLINGARARVEVHVGGRTEQRGYTDKTFVRCRCSRGERFKQFPDFDHRYCVSLMPGGERIAEEVCAPIDDKYAWKPTMSHAEAIAASEAQREEERAEAGQ